MVQHYPEKPIPQATGLAMHWRKPLKTAFTSYRAAQAISLAAKPLKTAFTSYRAAQAISLAAKACTTLKGSALGQFG